MNVNMKHIKKTHRKHRKAKGGLFVFVFFKKRMELLSFFLFFSFCFEKQAHSVSERTQEGSCFFFLLHLFFGPVFAQNNGRTV